MNVDKLKKLEAEARAFAKGSTPRRKKKVVVTRPSFSSDILLKKIGRTMNRLYEIHHVDEANIIKIDGTVIHFSTPRARTNIDGGVIAIVGHGALKLASDMPSSIFGSASVAGKNQQKKKQFNYWASTLSTINEEDESEEDVVSGEKVHRQEDVMGENLIISKQKETEPEPMMETGAC